MDGQLARALLGIAEEGACPEDIRRAFRARALATHPDRGGDRTSFELTVLAFETLQHVDVLPAPRPRTEPLPGARSRFNADDSPPRAAPKHRFADELRIALSRHEYDAQRR